MRHTNNYSIAAGWKNGGAIQLGMGHYHQLYEYDDEYNFDDSLMEESLDYEMASTKVPTPGRYYDIQYGKGGLLKTAQRAYKTNSDAERRKRAQEINGHPLNRKFWKKPGNDYERKYFTEGIIDFNPSFTCGENQRRATRGEKRCFAKIWMPPIGMPTPEPVKPPEKPKPPPSPVQPPKRDMPKPPRVPMVEPRFMLEHQFTKIESAFARKAWVKAVRHVYYTRWFIKYMARQDRTTRMRLWNGEASFPGNYGDGIPKVWFGDYNDARFGNVRHAVNRIWEKFRKSPWKMKRHNCIVWAHAHVIAAPQIRLCDSFFGKGRILPSGKPKYLSSEQIPISAGILVHEMSHHIWITSPRRLIKDTHVAPIPPCTGINKSCSSEQDARMLANKYPKHAVANPDNYAHFTSYYGSHLPRG